MIVVNMLTKYQNYSGIFIISYHIYDLTDFGIEIYELTKHELHIALKSCVLLDIL